MLNRYIVQLYQMWRNIKTLYSFSLGEKLTKEEAKGLMKELCEPEDDEGFMPFMRKYLCTSVIHHKMLRINISRNTLIVRLLLTMLLQTNFSENAKFEINCFYKRWCPWNFQVFLRGNLLAHCIYYKYFFDESSQNFTLYVQFMLAFIQTTAFQGNLPKKADL